MSEVGFRRDEAADLGLGGELDGRQAAALGPHEALRRTGEHEARQSMYRAVSAGWRAPGTSRTTRAPTLLTALTADEVMTGLTRKPRK